MYEHDSAHLQKTNTPTSTSDWGVLQRKCACGNHTGAGGDCTKCRKKRLQRKATNYTEPSTIPPIVHEVLRSPGQPLDVATRAFMEPRFGHDFSQVRVHTDVRAAESARAVNALAYTMGSNVVFGAGEYTPDTNTGKKLIAHELTHVVQQHGSIVAPDRVGTPNAPEERQANELATHFAVENRNRSLSQTNPGIVMRQTKAKDTPETEKVGPGFWATVGGGVVGEFNEDPTFAMIGVDLGVSLIPILDQVSDVRDIIAHLYYMIGERQYDRFMRWLGLVFTLIGLVPEVGSVIKGASKFVIKGVREVLNHMGDLLGRFQRVVPDIVDFGRLRQYIASNWDRWAATGTAVWNAMIEYITRVINKVPSFLNWQIKLVRDAITRIRNRAPGKLKEAFAWVRQKWNTVIERVEDRLGKPKGQASADTDGMRSVLRQRQYQNQLDRAIGDAEEQARRRGRSIMDGVENPANRSWIEIDPRHRELAFDPAHRSFSDESVAEARAALTAERQGIGTKPFNRDLTGGSGAADFVDGANIRWDHYAPHGRSIDDEVASLFKKLTMKDYNVLFDATHIGPLYRRKLLLHLQERLQQTGRIELTSRIAFVGVNTSPSLRRLVRTVRIAGRTLEEDSGT